MTNNLYTRNCIRILLFNNNNQLLLIYAEDPSTTTMDGKYNGAFWFTIGGEIEKGETIKNAAIRELYEETGLIKTDVKFGPIVWFGEFKLIVSGIPTLLKQQFIVAHTKNHNISLENLTKTEKKVIKKCEWFSIEKIKNHPEIIYPVGLNNYTQETSKCII